MTTARPAPSPGPQIPAAWRSRRRMILAAVVVLLAFLYFSGRLDKPLSSVGLNLHPCVTNGFGATFCGQAAKNYCRTLDSTGVNALNATSASTCASIVGPTPNP